MSRVIGSLITGAFAANSCGGPLPSDLSPGKLVKRVIQQADSNPLLGTIPREYSVRLPKTYAGDEPLPVFFYFHGWGDDYEADMKFHRMSNQQNAIVVKCNGMTDGQEDMRSWNVGQAGRTDICNHQDVTEYEYTSCLTSHNTSICNCGTCYDDVKFISDLTAKLKGELCIDDDRIFMSGASHTGVTDGGGWREARVTAESSFFLHVFLCCCFLFFFCEAKQAGENKSSSQQIPNRAMGRICSSGKTFLREAKACPTEKQKGSRSLVGRQTR